ncbi:hypothetical protein FLK61_27500 [Paenalkalicoccus suaedae]|uniref:Uncharacterized protein n=1 Tax=Paenalkalicoccus suaedae TaxID=2592382 RepID=A0A859FCJ1_9BACI|nr:hypothetical protein [Paenalkalicoccus suaedae]QKS70501.1 hypothetical protein FLK61_27500 [Paenalkalicoccus suaedae]
MVTVFLIIGLIGLGICSFVVYSFMYQAQQRATFKTEAPAKRDVRVKVAAVSGGVGILFILLAALLYFL